MTPEEAADSFWNWSLETYREDGVKDALLALQDGFLMNANLVLWSIWSARKGWILDNGQVTAIALSIDEFSTRAVERLREVRRYLNGPRPGFPYDTLLPLRKEVLAAELHAEKLAQTRLALSTLDVAGAPGGPPQETRDTTARSHFNALPLRLEKPLILGDELVSGKKRALFDGLLERSAGKEPA